MMTSTPARKPTLLDIATEAGVSVPTVSKVLNGKSDVAAPTRARVEQLIRERGYRRAEMPGDRPADTGIHLVTTGLASSWAGVILEAVESAAFDAGFEVIVSVDRSQDPGRPGRSWVDRVLHRGSRGVLAALVEVSADERRRLAEAGIPLVVIDPVSDAAASGVTGGSANRAGGRGAEAVSLPGAARSPRWRRRAQPGQCDP